MEHKSLPDLKNGDLQFLCQKSPSGLDEAIQLVIPHLKPNLTQWELGILKSTLTVKEKSFKRRWRKAYRSIPRFTLRHGPWLQAPVKVPGCLLRDGPLPLSNSDADIHIIDTEEIHLECANCQKDFMRNAEKDESTGLDDCRQAFQTVFEGLLIRNAGKVPSQSEIKFDLPELCSNCETLIMSLHKNYVEFMESTTAESPVRKLLRKSVLWKNWSEDESEPEVESGEPEVQPTPPLPAVLTRKRKRETEPKKNAKRKPMPKSKIKHPKITKNIQIKLQRLDDVGFLEQTNPNMTGTLGIKKEDDDEDVPVYDYFFGVDQDASCNEDYVEDHVEDNEDFVPPRAPASVVVDVGEALQGKRSRHPPKTYEGFFKDESESEEFADDDNDPDFDAASASEEENDDLNEVLTPAPTKAPKTNEKRPVKNRNVSKRKKFDENTNYNASKNEGDDGGVNPDQDFSSLIVIPDPDSNNAGYPRRSSRPKRKSKHYPDSDDSDANDQDEDYGADLQDYKDGTEDIVVEDNPNLDCPYCERVCAGPGQYRSHVQWHSAPEFPCPYCGDLVKGVTYLKMHIRYSHPNRKVDVNQARPFACPVKPCLTSYRGGTRANLKEHIRDYHPAEDRRPFKCDSCPRSFGEQSMFDKHKLITHTSYTCTICSKVIVSKSRFNTHMKYRHDPAYITKLVVCTICGKQVTDKYLDRHMEVHKPPEERQLPSLCDLCGKSFMYKSKLKWHHRVVHQQIKNHVCQHCGAAFSTGYLLKGHVIRRHTENTGPGYPCPICGKEFRMMEDMKQHLRSKVHGGPGQNRGNVGSRSRNRIRNQESTGSEQLVVDNYASYPVPMQYQDQDPHIMTQEVQVEDGSFVQKFEYGFM